ncbi:MAG: DNA-deoxyinosine glycosylase [Elusimicrobia bacterium]|nr:DNA-deoxyinosine glycosylase [Elusimicrobiota bacterium]
MRKKAFPPVLGRKPRVLILGSLPGDASLKLRQYYGHPRNRFWELVGAALGEDLRSLPYAKRLRRLKARGVALWDVIESGRRAGSLDSAIRDEAPNDIYRFITKTGVRAVFFNGRKAESSFRRHVDPPPENVALITLPSSSPAHASVPWSRKLAAWKRLRRTMSLSA